VASSESPALDECSRVLDRLTCLGYVYGPDRPGTLFPALDWARANGDVTEGECEAVGRVLGLADCCVTTAPEISAKLGPAKRGTALDVRLADGERIAGRFYAADDVALRMVGADGRRQVIALGQVADIRIDGK
jgi:hypothetical protein